MDNRVFIARCSDYGQTEKAVGRVLGAFGGAEAILSSAGTAAVSAGASPGKRKKVLVKPNLIMPKKPEDAATTHPAVMEAVCSAFVKAGADVSILDSTGGPHTKIVLKLLYGKTGMKKAALAGGAGLCFDTSSRREPLPDGRAADSLELLSPVLDADLVVSVAKAKTHSFQSMTGCVKNMFGCVAGMGKPNLHRKYPKPERFAAMLVDICERIKPGLSILDGVWGMEGAGPTGGEPKHLGVIAGSLSPYAVDLAQCHLMGLRLDSVYTIKEAFERSLAPEDPGLLDWLGDPREEFRKSFKPAIERKDDTIPEITDKCTGCGDCVRICPMKCITLDSGRAVVDGTRCIRCYCCHEFCPSKAISL